MMRVTNKMLVNTVVNNLQTSVAVLDRTQNQISTGKRVTRPADDPAAVSLGVRLRYDRASDNQYLRNIEQAKTWLTSGDQALSDVGDTLARIRELSVQASSDSYSSSDRAMIGAEAEQLRDHVLSTLNATILVDQHLFSGMKASSGPFSQDANGNVVYNGDRGTSSLGATLTTANGIETINALESNTAGTYRVALGTSGTDRTITITNTTTLATQTVTFTPPTSPVISTVDFSNLGIVMTVNSNTAVGTTADYAASAATQFTTKSVAVAREVGPNSTLTVSNSGANFLKMFADVKSLVAALNSTASTSQSLINAGIGDVDSAVDRLLTLRAELGAKTNRLEFTGQRMKDLEIEVSRLQSVNEDLDFADALTRLATQQGIYRAALEAGARTAPMSILDFLR